MGPHLYMESRGYSHRPYEAGVDVLQLIVRVQLLTFLILLFDSNFWWSVLLGHNRNRHHRRYLDTGPVGSQVLGFCLHNIILIWCFPAPGLNCDRTCAGPYGAWLHCTSSWKPLPALFSRTHREKCLSDELHGHIWGFLKTTVMLKSFSNLFCHWAHDYPVSLSRLPDYPSPSSVGICTLLWYIGLTACF